MADLQQFLAMIGAVANSGNVQVIHGSFPERGSASPNAVPKNKKTEKLERKMARIVLAAPQDVTLAIRLDRVITCSLLATDDLTTYGETLTRLGLQATAFPPVYYKRLLAFRDHYAVSCLYPDFLPALHNLVYDVKKDELPLHGGTRGTALFSRRVTVRELKAAWSTLRGQINSRLAELPGAQTYYVIRKSTLHSLVYFPDADRVLDFSLRIGDGRTGKSTPEMTDKIWAEYRKKILATPQWAAHIAQIVTSVAAHHGLKAKTPEDLLAQLYRATLIPAFVSDDEEID